MSIWTGISRLDFVHNLSELEELAPSQTISALPLPAVNGHIIENRPGLILSEEWERQLTDDLSFVAVWENAPASVTAATVSSSPGSRSLIVTIAANEGIAPQVEETFNRLLERLSSCASCGQSPLGVLCVY